MSDDTQVPASIRGNGRLDRQPPAGGGRAAGQTRNGEKHFAAKADLEAIATMMERHFNRLLRWGLGIMITAAGALSALIFGLTGMNGN